MAKTLIENVGAGSVLLPYPLSGVLAPGERAVVTGDVTTVSGYFSPFTALAGLRFSSVGDSANSTPNDSAKTAPYDLLIPAPAGTLSAGQVLGPLVLPRPFTIPAGAGSHVGRVGTNPTSTAAFTITKNGVTCATFTVSTSGVFVFSAPAAAAFAVGDVLRVVAPTPADATLADFSVTIVGVA